MQVATYVPGLRVYCNSEVNDPTYLSEGWHAPERHSTWMHGSESLIRFRVRRPAESYQLTLDVTPVDFPDIKQDLELYFNFFRVGFFNVRKSESIQVVLPYQLFILPACVITLHCRSPVVPADFGKPDSRFLGLALRSWIME